MTNSFLWSTEDHDTNLSQFKKKILHKIKDNSYASLHNWSVKNKSEFWSAIWDFTSIKGKIKQPIIPYKNIKDQGCVCIAYSN